MANNQTWDELAGEFVNDDEYQYRTHLRNAIANGEITASLNDDGSWSLGDPNQGDGPAAYGNVSENMLGKNKAPAAAPAPGAPEPAPANSDSLLSEGELAATGPDNAYIDSDLSPAMKGHPPGDTVSGLTPGEQSAFIKDSRDSFAPIPGAIRDPGANAPPDIVSGDAGYPKTKFDMAPKESTPQVLADAKRQLTRFGLPPALLDIPDSIVSFPGGGGYSPDQNAVTIGEGQVGMGGGYSPAWMAMHESLHAFEANLNPDESEQLRQIILDNLPPEGVPTAHHPPGGTGPGDPGVGLPDYFDFLFGGYHADEVGTNRTSETDAIPSQFGDKPPAIPAPVLQFIKDHADEVLKRVKDKTTFEHVLPYEVATATPVQEELEGDYGNRSQTQYRESTTGESDANIQNAIYTSLGDLPVALRAQLLQFFKEARTPTDQKVTVDTVSSGANTVIGGGSGNRVVSFTKFGLGMGTEEAWQYMIQQAKMVETDTATTPGWQTWMDNAAMNVLDPVTFAAKKALGQEGYESQPGWLKTAETWAPVLVAPETGIFKKLPIIGGMGAGLGVKQGAFALGGAVAAHEAADLTGLPELPAEMLGALLAPMTLGRRWAMVENSLRMKNGEIDYFAGMGNRNEAIAKIQELSSVSKEEATKFYDLNYKKKLPSEIDDGVAAQLNAIHDGVKNAGPDELVTLYHSTTSANAQSINETGFKEGGLTPDPEVARLHALNNGFENPVLLAFQVPRRLIQEKGWYFTARQILKPIANELTDGWIDNPMGLVRSFLRDETGSLRLPSFGDNAIPDDVSKLAFGEQASRDLSDGGVLFQVDDLTSQARHNEGYGGFRKQGDSLEPLGIDIAYPDVEGPPWNFNRDTLRETYEREHRKALDADDRLNAMQNDPSATPEDVFNLRKEMYDSLHWVQRFGEALFRVTGGQEGVPQKMRRAIDQLMAEEEGSIRMPSFREQPDYTTPGSVPKFTMQVLGVQPIQPRLKLSEKVFDFLHVSRADPLANRMGEEDVRVRENIKSISAASATQFYYLADRFFKADTDGLILEFKKKTVNVTLQDIAANWKFWQPNLSIEQNLALERMRQVMEPYYKANIEQGIKLRTRGDIQPGGFYMPRGNAIEDGVQYEQWGVTLPKRRSNTRAFNRDALFNTQAEGIANGWQYHSLADTMGVYFREQGEALLDKHWANVLLNTRDAAGVPLSMTAEARLLANNPKMVARIGSLRKQLSSLMGSVQQLDTRIHGELATFINTPAPDLDALQQTISQLYTKNGQIRMRLTDAQKQQLFKDIRKQVREDVFRNRGKYKGMTAENARKEALKERLDVRIRRGRFQGVDYAQAQNMINGVRSTIASMSDQWRDAKQAALKTDTTVTRMVNGQAVEVKQLGIGHERMGLNLEGHSFDEGLASVLNDHLKSMRAPTGRGAWAGNVFWNAPNNFIRTLRSTADLSFTFIQGLLSLVHDPDSFRIGWGGAVKSMLDPVNGKYVMGKYVDDFNRAALRNGGPSAQDWAAAGLHIGGMETEFTSGKGLGRVPVILQANRAFGDFGDIVRLNSAANILKGKPTNLAAMREIAQSRNLMTGYSPNTAFGPVGSLAMFAPRFFQSQLELIGKSLHVTNRTISQKEAQHQIRDLLGVAVGMTIAANELSGAENFDYTTPYINGHLNPNFMRIRVGGPIGDVSLLGSFDSLLKAAAATANGDFSYLPRTKANPLVSILWDQITGETFVGEHVPQIRKNLVDASNLLKHEAFGTDYAVEGDWKPGVWAEYTARAMLPFLWADPVADAASGKKSISDAAISVGVSSTGLKSSPLSNSEIRTQKVTDMTQTLIADGTIPAEMVDVFKSTPFHELPSSFQKLINTEITNRDPEYDAQYHKTREAQGNIYETVTQSADQTRRDYDKRIMGLWEELQAGGSQKEIWDAYDTLVKEERGALGEDYRLENDKGPTEYGKAVSNLGMSDFRKLEAFYDAAYDRHTNNDITNWSAVDADQQGFVEQLRLIDPQKAAVFEYSLALRDKLNSEKANPMQQLKKTTTEELKPYYDMTDADEKADWLRTNPQADYHMWLTATWADPKVHSVMAAESAVRVSGGKREVRLSDSTQQVTTDNIELFKQFDKQITLLYNTPYTREAGGNTFHPIDDLRKADPLYDALWFWLGRETPVKGKNTVSVYHLDAVKRYLAQWGARSDGVRPEQK